MPARSQSGPLWRRMADSARGMAAAKKRQIEEQRAKVKAEKERKAERRRKLKEGWEPQTWFDENGIARERMVKVRHNPNQELEDVIAADSRDLTHFKTALAIPKDWMHQWLHFTTFTRQPPGPLDNTVLLDENGQILAHLAIIHHYRLVSPPVWQVLAEYYGGGPIISVRVPKVVRLGNVPLKRWLSQVDLATCGTVTDTMQDITRRASSILPPEAEDDDEDDTIGPMGAVHSPMAGSSTRLTPRGTRYSRMSDNVEQQDQFVALCGGKSGVTLDDLRAWPEVSERMDDGELPETLIRDIWMEVAPDGEPEIGLSAFKQFVILCDQRAVQPQAAQDPSMGDLFKQSSLVEGENPDMIQGENLFTRSLSNASINNAPSPASVSPIAPPDAPTTQPDLLTATPPSARNHNSSSGLATLL